MQDPLQNLKPGPPQRCKPGFLQKNRKFFLLKTLYKFRFLDYIAIETKNVFSFGAAQGACGRKRGLRSPLSGIYHFVEGGFLWNS
jgi:hypothetical protein